ncbi:MAG: ABC transporter permease [Ilumatobacteraceae bacterium]|nr:ABC transporter permease [Ilumatobacteraceae bacterium]HQZ36035.1 ABC transporter permease [Ilumatobacteraceae bacterium]HRB03350.1 ABC transporter permease [Ilumatobacteraceae bacterium]
MTAENTAEWVVNSSRRRRRLDLQLSQLWKHRELAFFFAYRDVRVRYKQALLGGAWAVLQPLVGALMFTIVFNRVAEIEVDSGSYFAFATAGFVTWNYVSAAVGSGTGSLLYNGELLTKVSFPRLIIPIAAIMPGLIDLTIGLIVAVVASLVTGGSFSVTGALVGLPLGLALLIISVCGAVMYFSAKVVKYRDVMVLVSFGLQIMLFLTPIAYPPSQLPEAWQTVAYINPVAGAVGLIRSGVIGAEAPTVGQVGLSAGVAVVGFLLALVSFRSHEREFADVI